MKRPDGIETALPPSPGGLAIGVIGVIAGIGLCTWSICLGTLMVPVFGLVIFNAVRGRERTRVLPNKLLVEYSRPVRELLIGPSKERVPWGEFQDAVVEGDHVKVTDKQGGSLEIGKGCPPSELEDLVERIHRISKQDPIT